ncbi:MAG: sulfatase-like hydrolase/transferase [Armatimonadota bacterium]|jgi:arylsulfatase
MSTSPDGAADARTQERPPSFLIFVTDQNRWDLMGCAGHPVLETPSIDALAERGVRLDRHYTIHPLCMPTRSTFFTGLTPRGHGTRCNGIPLDPTVPTITQTLAHSGYRTHGIGKIHLTPFGTMRDVDPASLSPERWPESRKMWQDGRIEAVPTPYYGLQSLDFIGGHGPGAHGDYRKWLLQQEPDADRLMSPEASDPVGTGPERVWRSALPADLHYVSWMADRAIDFLGRQAEDGEPFFLWCSFPDPHPAYTCGAPWANMYSPDDVPLPTRREGELADLPPHYQRLFDEGVPTAGRMASTNIPDHLLRRVRAMVYGMISQIDHAMGRVLSALDKLGLQEDTVVVFMADHGNMLGDHWMMNMPPTHLDGTLRVPSVWSWPGHFEEGRATEALGSHLDFAPTVLDLAGLPIPEGVAPPTPEAPEQLPPWPGESLAPVLTGEAEIVRDAVIAENDEDYLGLRLRTLVTPNYHLTVYAGQPYGELFDLREDPEQLFNLWDDPDRQALRHELQALLLDRLALTDSVVPRRLCHA